MSEGSPGEGKGFRLVHRAAEYAPSTEHHARLAPIDLKAHLSLQPILPETSRSEHGCLHHEVEPHQLLGVPLAACDDAGMCVLAERASEGRATQTLFCWTTNVKNKAKGGVCIGVPSARPLPPLLKPYGWRSGTARGSNCVRASRPARELRACRRRLTPRGRWVPHARPRPPPPPPPCSYANNPRTAQYRSSLIIAQARPPSSTSSAHDFAKGCLINDPNDHESQLELSGSCSTLREPHIAKLTDRYHGHLSDVDNVPDQVPRHVLGPGNPRHAGGR